MLKKGKNRCSHVIIGTIFIFLLWCVMPSFLLLSKCSTKHRDTVWLAVDHNCYGINLLYTLKMWLNCKGKPGFMWGYIAFIYLPYVDLTNKALFVPFVPIFSNFYLYSFGEHKKYRNTGILRKKANPFKRVTW